MNEFVVRRFLQGLITLALLAIIIFILSRASGNPLDVLLPVDTSPEVRQAMERRFRLDRSYPEQFWFFILDLLRGDLGTSIGLRTPVWELFWDRFPNSLLLVVPSFVVAFVLGVPLGVVSALRRGRASGRLADVVGVVGVATPNFWVGILLIMVFSSWLGWLPSARMTGPASFILPIVTLSTFLVAGIMRLVRSNMLEVLDAEFVKLARLKGVPNRRVVWHHALRNSLLPAISFAGTFFAVLITGTIVIETVFAWPGVGRLLHSAVISRDFPLVQGILLIKAALIVGVNLFIDILYAWLDPRIRT